MSHVNVKTLTALAAAALISTPALAAEDMSYSYIQASYVDTNLDNPDVDGDGFAASGSVEISEHFFIGAGLANQEFDFNVDLNQWSVGLGGHMPLADNLDLVGTLSYVDAELETGFGDIDDDGYGATVGLRAALTPEIELEGGISYVDLDDAGDDTTFNLGARYYFTPEFAVGAGVSTGDDVTSWNVGVRFEF